MTDDLKRNDIRTTIRSKLIELIRLSVEHDIDIAMLMYEALDFCDPEPPFSR